MGLRRLTQFPPLASIKQLDNVINGNESRMTGFLNVAVTLADRPEITGPFSLFSNRKGSASYHIDGKRFTIEENTFLMMNRGQQYDLLIDNKDTTVIQNIHFNENLIRAAYTTFINSSEQLLDKTINFELLEFNAGMFVKNNSLQQLLDSTSYLGHMEEDEDDSILLAIMDCLFWENDKARKAALAIPAVKESVRQELFCRIRTAQDYMWSNYKNELSIDELCLEIGMSKFHFLRVFKSCIGCSPYQYLKSVRHQRALHLLRTSKMMIQEIAFQLGYEVVNSFIKSFHQIEGVSPQKFREKIK